MTWSQALILVNLFAVCGIALWNRRISYRLRQIEAAISGLATLDTGHSE